LLQIVESDKYSEMSTLGAKGKHTSELVGSADRQVVLCSKI